MTLLALILCCTALSALLLLYWLEARWYRRFMLREQRHLKGIARTLRKAAEKIPLVLVVVCAPAWATVPVELTAAERVDSLELNHHHCAESGNEIFIQLIFWTWEPKENTHRVAAWRMQKDEHLIPYRDWDRGGWSVLWLDGEAVRIVHAAGYEETWGTVDPELIDREHLPRDRRRELRQPARP